MYNMAKIQNQVDAQISLCNQVVTLVSSIRDSLQTLREFTDGAQSDGNYPGYSENMADLESMVNELLGK